MRILILSFPLLKCSFPLLLHTQAVVNDGDDDRCYLKGQNHLKCCCDFFWYFILFLIFVVVQKWSTEEKGWETQKVCEVNLRSVYRWIRQWAATWESIIGATLWWRGRSFIAKLFLWWLSTARAWLHSTLCNIQGACANETYLSVKKKNRNEKKSLPRLARVSSFFLPLQCWGSKKDL